MKTLREYLRENNLEITEQEKDLIDRLIVARDCQLRQDSDGWFLGSLSLTNPKISEPARSLERKGILSLTEDPDGFYWVEINCYPEFDMGGIIL